MPSLPTSTSTPRTRHRRPQTWSRSRSWSRSHSTNPTSTSKTTDRQLSRRKKQRADTYLDKDNCFDVYQSRRHHLDPDVYVGTSNPSNVNRFSVLGNKPLINATLAQQRSYELADPFIPRLHKMSARYSNPVLSSPVVPISKKLDRRGREKSTISPTDYQISLSPHKSRVLDAVDTPFQIQLSEGNISDDDNCLVVPVHVLEDHTIHVDIPSPLLYRADLHSIFEEMSDFNGTTKEPKSSLPDNGISCAGVELQTQVVPKKSLLKSNESLLEDAFVAARLPHMGLTSIQSSLLERANAQDDRHEPDSTILSCADPNRNVWMDLTLKVLSRRSSTAKQKSHKQACTTTASRQAELAAQRPPLSQDLVFPRLAIPEALAPGMSDAARNASSSNSMSFVGDVSIAACPTSTCAALVSAHVYEHQYLGWSMRGLGQQKHEDSSYKRVAACQEKEQNTNRSQDFQAWSIGLGFEPEHESGCPFKKPTKWTTVQDSKTAHANLDEMIFDIRNICAEPSEMLLQHPPTSASGTTAEALHNATYNSFSDEGWESDATGMFLSEEETPDWTDWDWDSDMVESEDELGLRLTKQDL